MTENHGVGGSIPPLGTILLSLLAFILLATPASAQNGAELSAWRAQAQRVTIVRDDWGIAHVRGRSDADAVFGAIYAQAEDDFNRVETNLLTSLGRLAEAEGESALWQDLRQRLWIDHSRLQADYRRSPAWLRRLMDAWAAGLNFYLATHPEVRPRVLTRFEPWMALSFTEGSIGGDIERADLGQLAALYGPGPQVAARPHDGEPRGSNGIAIAPRLTRDGHALLLINPHTSFFFRSELQMTSDEGLNAYGASTWGQFFIYQGFNERVGWMHTSSGTDNVDEFQVEIVQRRGDPFYRYGREQRPLTIRPIELRVRQADGSLASRRFTTYATHHGPIVRAAGTDRWIALAIMHRPVEALQQSWLRTRARNFDDYLRVAGLRANSSNNTIYADADGRIAYLHPQFMPRRDQRFDYRQPVDGSDPATDWRGLLPLAELPMVRDPRGHWVYNANDAPWRAAGADSPRAEAFPRVMDTAGDNPRGDHAIALLREARDLTPEALRRIAYDPHMPLFETLIPALNDAWAGLGPHEPRRVRLREPVAMLARWDRRWAAGSEATTLANFWAMELWARAETRREPHQNMWAAIAALPAIERLDALDRAVTRLRTEWGSWRVRWGEVNRFQRNDGAIVQRFDDGRPSVPVPFASARWGSLASFGARAYPGTRRWYGTSGNSFVAIVQFGPRVRAWAVSAGGESGDPASRHFSDQAGRYAAGDLRPVYFHPDELAGHIARTYRPGE